MVEIIPSYKYYSIFFYLSHKLPDLQKLAISCVALVFIFSNTPDIPFDNVSYQSRPKTYSTSNRVSPSWSTIGFLSVLIIFVDHDNHIYSTISVHTLNSLHSSINCILNVIFIWLPVTAIPREKPYIQ